MSSPMMAIPSDTQSNENPLLSINQIVSLNGIAEKDEKGNTFILSNVRGPLDIQWSVTMNFNEPGGQYTYAIFGEAPDASG